MIAAIKNGFGGLLRFSGRDRRGMFWPYAGLIVFLTFMVSNVAMAVMMARTFSADLAVEEKMTPNLVGFFRVNGLITGIMVLFLAAAVARRLHDIGRSGYWGLAPVPFVAGAMVLFPLMIRDFEGDGANAGALFGLIAINNLFYMATFVTLIVLLSLRGKPEVNRYGPPPVMPDEEETN